MAKRKTTPLDETTWQTATALGMQRYMLRHGLSTRRLQLLVVACGDLIRDWMASHAKDCFAALARTAEGDDTEADRRRLKGCGPLKNWLSWCLGVGKRTTKLKTATAALAREVFGNPFRPAAFSPAWRTDTAVALARQMYEGRDFGAMPILADALQDAGCDNEDVLAHCRDAKQTHVRGCWVLDLVLGKE